MHNTIILRYGKARLTSREYKCFSKGDIIWGIDRDAEELKRWSTDREAEAKKELAKYRCTYERAFDDWEIREYALEYCERDEDGEFISGSDYDLAEE